MYSVYHDVLTRRDIPFVELGGGVGDVPVWCRDGAYVSYITAVIY